MRIDSLLFAALVPLMAVAQSDPCPGQQATYQQGLCLLKAGQWDAAAPLLKAHVDAAPDDAHGWLMLADAELYGKHFDQARTDALRSIRLNGKSAEAYRTLGEVELERKDNQAAYQAWLKAHDLDPNDPHTDYYLGRLFFEAEFWNEAASWLRQTLQLAPQDFAAMTYLGMSAERLSFEDTAVGLYKAAIGESKRQGKPYSWAYLAYAKFLHQSGKDDEALKLLEEAEKLCPEPHALSLFGQLLASSEPKRAEAVLRRALAMDPAIPDAHYHLALLLRASGREPEAQAQFEEFRKAKATEDAKSRIQAIRKPS